MANEVHEKLREAPLTTAGIRLVSSVRKGYSGYYLWAVDNTSTDLFFAGRSVLQRIETDFHSREIGAIEQVLLRRIREGCVIRIMFLDPRSDLVERLAIEEGQTTDQMLIDLAKSVGVVVRLSNLLCAQYSLSAPAKLQIRIYDEVPYFAYHRVADEAIVGFYFSSALGHASAAYELVDPQTQSFFEGHFLSMFERARDGNLLELDRHRGEVNLSHETIQSIKKSLEGKLGAELTEQLVGSAVEKNA